jgi:hypothetical protein
MHEKENILQPFFNAYMRAGKIAQFFAFELHLYARPCLQ